MNKIFERIITIEHGLNSLIEDLNMESEECPNNKEEIEHELIVASRCVSRVYLLNKENFLTLTLKNILTKTENGINVTFMNTSMELEIVERSSGYWIVDDYGVAWDEPFIHLSQAIRQYEIAW